MGYTSFMVDTYLVALAILLVMAVIGAIILKYRANKIQDLKNQLLEVTQSNERAVLEADRSRIEKDLVAADEARRKALDEYKKSLQCTSCVDDHGTEWRPGESTGPGRKF